MSYPDGRVRRYLPVECERLQGFPDNWTLPNPRLPTTEKLDAKRYKALGNAVTVNVAEWLAHRIARYLTRSSATMPHANWADRINGVVSDPMTSAAVMQSA